MKYIPLFLIILVLLLCGCRRSGQDGPLPKDPQAPSEHVQSPEYSVPIREEAQLLCLARTQEEARTIAALYGIELVSWYDGLATFRTQEDPREVIARGEEEGWPELSVNHTVKLY